MADQRWWSLRKTTSQIYVEYDHTHATLFATDVRMQKGPPIAIGLDLEKNVRTHHTSVGTYVDAKALADGAIRQLKRVELHDEHVLTGLRHFLRDTGSETAPWRLIVRLKGRHEFSVKPEYRNQGQGGVLILRVVE